MTKQGIKKWNYEKALGGEGYTYWKIEYESMNENFKIRFSKSDFQIVKLSNCFKFDNLNVLGSKFISIF